MANVPTYSQRLLLATEVSLKLAQSKKNSGDNKRKATWEQKRNSRGGEQTKQKQTYAKR